MEAPAVTTTRYTIPYTIGNLNNAMNSLSIEGGEEQSSTQKVRNYALDNIQQKRVTSCHKRGIWRLKELPQNKVATASYDKTAKIFFKDPTSGKWDTDQTKNRMVHKKEVLSLGFYDERTLITGSSDGLLKFWDISDGKLKKSFGENERYIRGFYSLAILNENIVATGSCQKPKKVNYKWSHDIKLWNAVSGKITNVLSGHSGGISSLVTLTNSERLLSVSGDATVRIWDIKKSNSIAIFKGHTDYIYCAALVSQGQNAATGGRDRSIKIWDIETGQSNPLVDGSREVAHTSTVYDLSTLDDHLLVSGSRDCNVRIWDCRTLTLVRTIDSPFFIYSVTALSDGTIVAGGPEAEKKKPKEGGELTFINFV